MSVAIQSSRLSASAAILRPDNRVLRRWSEADAVEMDPGGAGEAREAPPPWHNEPFTPKASFMFSQMKIVHSDYKNDPALPYVTPPPTRDRSPNDLSVWFTFLFCLASYSPSLYCSPFFHWHCYEFRFVTRCNLLFGKALKLFYLFSFVRVTFLLWCVPIVYWAFVSFLCVFC